jgi:quercetin dioxygenase-like cupin family protein
MDETNKNNLKNNACSSCEPKMNVNAKLIQPIHTIISEMKREAAGFQGEITRSAIRGDNFIMVFNWIKPHEDNAPFHQHPFDQTVYIAQGTIKFTVVDKGFILHAGETLQIPAGAPHKGWVIGDETVLDIDIFSPIREDYLYLVDHQIEAFDVKS